MENLIEKAKINAARRKAYFIDQSADIALKNLKQLQYISMLVSILLIVFLLLTPLVIKEWEITPQHIGFLPVLLLSSLLAYCYRKKGTLMYKTINVLCILFFVVIFVFVLLIDIYTNVNAPGTFMPVLCIALPVVFIMPARIIYAVLTVFESIYVYVALMAKNPFIAQYDVFDSVVGLLLAFAVSEVTVNFRLQDHEMQTKYQQLSRRDSLSGILNKMAFEESSRSYLRMCGSKASCAMMVLDVDDFKNVNDEFGHYTGDQLLRIIGEMLSRIFRITDIVGRFGGDEFVVLIKDMSDLEVLDKKCSALRDGLKRQSYGYCGKEITCSIGGVIVEWDSIEYEDLFRMADNALYKAKSEGKNRHVLEIYQEQQ